MTVPALPDQIPGPPPGSAVTPWDPGPLPVDPSPRDAIVLLLNESYLRCRLLGERLRQQVDADRGRTGGANPHAGLVGYKMARASDGTMYPTSEETRGLVKVELSERQFCAHLARQAHDLGITGGDWP